METSNEWFFGTATNSAEVLNHLSRAYEIINARMAGEDALSDKNISAIIMLILQEQIRQDQARIEMHQSGLRKMIAMRGGIATLESNMPLLLKSCKTDTTYALQTGKTLQISRDQLAEVLHAWQSRKLNVEPRGGSFLLAKTEQLRLDPILRDIMLDASRTGSVLNLLDPPSVVSMTEVEEAYFSLIGRLLRFHPLNDHRIIPTSDRIVHVGLTTYMVVQLFQSDSHRVLYFEPLIQRIMQIMEIDLTSLDTDIVLWFISLAGMWMSGSTGHAYFEQAAATLVAELGTIAKWSAIRPKIIVYPWIDKLMDQPVARFWHRLSMKLPVFHTKQDVQSFAFAPLLTS